MTGDQRDTTRDNHEAFDELAVGWALHALEPEDESAFAAHLAHCPRCARTVAETHEVMAAMASDLPAATPSDQLRERLRAAVEGTAQELRPASRPAAIGSTPPAPRPRSAPAGPADTDPGVVPLTGRRRADPPAATGFPLLPGRDQVGRSTWRRVLPNVLVAAAVTAILILGTWNVVVTGARDDARAAAAQQSDVMQALLAPGRVTIAPLHHDGQVVATVVARNGEAHIVADGLAVNNAADSTYVVWGILDGAPGPVALGTFDVVHSELDLRTVGSDQTGLGDFSAYGISLEPGRQAPSTPTAILANGQVTS